MRWLITVPAGTDLDVLQDAVRAAQGSLRDLDPIPLGEDEVVVFAEGPPDLPSLLSDTEVGVRQVSPDSEPEPY